MKQHYNLAPYAALAVAGAFACGPIEGGAENIVPPSEAIGTVNAGLRANNSNAGTTVQASLRGDWDALGVREGSLATLIFISDSGESVSVEGQIGPGHDVVFPLVYVAAGHRVTIMLVVRGADIFGETFLVVASAEGVVAPNTITDFTLTNFAIGYFAAGGYSLTATE
ncbi:MAG: hypothetical protein HYV07_33910 [Deltaproteobacteria bacterium]|nr:hypothetical protein [Deltaproteobacteria bacterium]